MRIVILLISVAALGLALFVGALGPGTRFGFWDYGFALGLMRQVALPTIVAAGLAIVALGLAVWRAQGLAALAFISAVAAGGAAYAPVKMRQMAQSNPFIHDITTDFDDPPEIIAAASAPRKNPAAYAGADPVRNSDKTVAEAQRAAFPDIGPLVVSAAPDEAAAATRATLRKMSMPILAEEPLTGGGVRIEAVATSFWYGFKDDFIVRIVPSDGGGARIDVRSKSRVGLSDLGANAARIRKFTSLLNASL